jgi:hypothetical protein
VVGGGDEHARRRRSCERVGDAARGRLLAAVQRQIAERRELGHLREHLGRVDADPDRRDVARAAQRGEHAREHRHARDRQQRAVRGAARARERIVGAAAPARTSAV